MAIMDDAMIIQRLMTLRVELFTAAQVLRGEPLKEFWKLIDDIQAIRPKVYLPTETVVVCECGMILKNDTERANHYYQTGHDSGVVKETKKV